MYILGRMIPRINSLDSVLKCLYMDVHAAECIHAELYNYTYIIIYTVHATTIYIYMVHQWRSPDV